MHSSVLSSAYTTNTGSLNTNAANSPTGTTISHMTMASHMRPNFASPPAGKMPAIVRFVMHPHAA